MNFTVMQSYRCIRQIHVQNIKITYYHNEKKNSTTSIINFFHL